MSAHADAALRSPETTEPLWRHPAFLWSLTLTAAAASTSVFWWGAIASALFEAEFAAAKWVPGVLIAEVSFILLPAVAFGGGLLASFSPCVLPLVPLNIAYVGAHEANGWKSVSLSARFVAGATLTLSTLGLFGDLAGFMLIDQRGFLLLGVGGALVYAGCAALDVVPRPIAGLNFASQSRLGPVGAGAAFAFVTAPCASPLLMGVLAAASAQSVPGLAVATMVSFSLGYTLLVFAGGALGGGLIAQAKRIPVAAPRAAAAGLLLVSGLCFGIAGAVWF